MSICMLPSLNRVWRCTPLDQDQSTAHIPIVALTSVAEQVPQDERFAFAAFLVKPCDPATFARVVERGAHDVRDAHRAGT